MSTIEIDNQSTIKNVIKVMYGSLHDANNIGILTIIDNPTVKSIDVTWNKNYERASLENFSFSILLNMSTYLCYYHYF